MKRSVQAEKLDSIADNILLFFPLFYRKLLRNANVKYRLNPGNMELRSLFILAEEGTMHSSELGYKLGVSKPNVTPLVDKLIKKGYVSRLPDEQDRRVINISITEKGKRFIAARKRILADKIKLNLSALKMEEMDALYSSLETFRDIISRVGEAR
jgi:MarR family 2-MHQ and catechol resistance regulon transcriptional repressor